MKPDTHDISRLDRSSEGDRISLEAASWVAQLDSGKISSADRLALAEWMARSPRHTAEIKRLAKLWGEVDLLVDEAVQQQPESALARLLPLWFSLQPLRASVAFTAPLLLIVALASVFFISDPSPQIVVYSAERGQHKEAILTDGSIIELNTNTFVEVEYSSTSRTVRLLQGEALFEVAKDTQRPFQVYAGKALVEAVGTAFLVRLYEKDVDVTVTEGLVRLEQTVPKEARLALEDGQQQSATTFLEAGERVRIGKQVAEIEPLPTKEIEKSMAWRKGLLVFESETLEHVIREVGRYMPQSIVISDPELGKMQMGGVFKIGEIDSLLAALESSLGVEVNRVRPDLIYLNKSGKN